jgi:hypothetical protein
MYINLNFAVFWVILYFLCCSFFIICNPTLTTVPVPYGATVLEEP